MTSRLPLPTPNVELPQMELRDKGDWRGLLTRIVGRVIQFGAWLGIGVAHRFMTHYSTVFAWQPRILWHPAGAPPGDSLRLHERVHAWHILTLGRLRYTWLWLRCRAECEGLAYASQVVAGLRTVASCVASLRRDYGLGMSDGELRVLVIECVQRWRDAGWTRERMLEEATRDS